MSPPPLPMLPASWKLRVFGKQSISQSVDGASGDVEALPDTERLAFIGDAIVYLGITSWLHERYPKHHNRSLTGKLMDLSSQKPGEWAKLYKLPSYVVVTPSGGPGEPKTHPISKGDLFRAYVGALYLNGGGHHGGGVITSGWIKQIMEFEEQDEHGHGDSGSDSDASSGDEIISTGEKNDDKISGMLNALLIPPNDPPKQKPAPQLPVNIPVSNTHNFLSHLNDKAIKRKKELTWDDSPTGPDHAKLWETKLTVEGKEFVGTGHNKKQARTAASEVALKTLKWM